MRRHGRMAEPGKDRGFGIHTIQFAHAPLHRSTS